MIHDQRRKERGARVVVSLSFRLVSPFSLLGVVTRKHAPRMIRRREQDPTPTRRIYRLHASHASSHPFPLQAGHSPSLESSPRTVSQHHLAGGARPSIPFSREHNDKKSVRLRSFRSLGFRPCFGIPRYFCPSCTRPRPTVRAPCRSSGTRAMYSPLRIRHMCAACLDSITPRPSDTEARTVVC